MGRKLRLLGWVVDGGKMTWCLFVSSDPVSEVVRNGIGFSE
jgi:hypothetical protein